MINNTFNYYRTGTETFLGVKVLTYSLKCNLNIHYIIEVEEHPENIFIIKFSQKNHKDSENRYSLLNTKKFLESRKTNGSKNFLTLLNTLMKISLEIYKENDKACFGFIGSPTLEEKNPKETNLKYKKKINIDGTVSETKRYNVYSIFIKRYFSPEKFEHIEIPTSSSYLLKSKKNSILTPLYVKKFFSNYFENFC